MVTITIPFERLEELNKKSVESQPLYMETPDSFIFVFDDGKYTYKSIVNKSDIIEKESKQFGEVDNAAKLALDAFKSRIQGMGVEVLDIDFDDNRPKKGMLGIDYPSSSIIGLKEQRIGYGFEREDEIPLEKVSIFNPEE